MNGHPVKSGRKRGLPRFRVSLSAKRVKSWPSQRGRGTDFLAKVKNLLERILDLLVGVKRVPGNDYYLFCLTVVGTSQRRDSRWNVFACAGQH